MNIKSTAILLLTLLIGFVLGVLSTGRFVQSQVSNLQQLRETPMQKLMETIAPTEEQRQQLEPVLQKYASEIKELNLQHKEILQETIDSLLSEIQPVLNGEQLNRIETRRKIMQERQKQGTLPPFNRWFMRQPFKKPPPQKPNAAGKADTLPLLPPQQELGNPPVPAAKDSARWQQKMQQRRQNHYFTPPPDSIKEIIWKKRQGETLTAKDSATLRQFRQQQREKRFSNSNTPDSLPPPPPHFKNRPRPFAPNDSAGVPPPGRKHFKQPKHKQARPQEQPGTANN
ncbi:hypothetical protein C7N43_00200 [Sphingobacteriales bacterium UPWRP_1]|nr:hypothetical protein BVG80_15130 [Sphingobacteriales bacterium TSM_CSM]PSJ79082.1 hypothetical protein C7N43_00200 [Sphingobacteriales bacterium UPWRP_1]